MPLKETTQAMTEVKEAEVGMGDGVKTALG